MAKWKSVDSPPEYQTNVLVKLGWPVISMCLWWYQPWDKKWYVFTYDWYIQCNDVEQWRKLPKLPTN